MTIKDIEIWKEIDGTNGKYLVSNFGRSARVLKIAKGTTGYNHFRPTINGRKKTGYLHRQIAKAFIPNPKNLPVVNHRDGNKLNNKVSNLEWTTASENTKHAFRLGLMRGISFPRPWMRKVVLSSKDGTSKIFPSITEACRILGISRTSIENCLKGRSKTAGKYKWSYAN